MKNLYQIIYQIQKNLNCPICSESYEIDKISLKGLFGKALIVQLICKNNHVTLLLTDYIQNEVTPINEEDLKNLHNNLINFDGDFRRIWQQ